MKSKEGEVMGYLGIDLGTSGVKIVYMVKPGHIEKQVTKEYPIYHPHPGWSEQHPMDWWDATVAGIQEILKEVQASNIAGIGLSGQMHGMVALDKNGEVLTPAILWNDQRTHEECLYLNNEVGREFLTKHTGNMAITGFTAPKILWLKKNEPEIFNQVRYFMLPKDFIGYKLTGEMFTDVSDASGTLYFNVEKRTWSQEVLDIIGINEDMLPKVYESYEVAAEINENTSNETGLPVGVKVVAGGGDNAAGAVGSGIIQEGTALISLGTSGVVFSPQKSYSVDENNRLHSFCDATGKWHVMGVMLSAAASLKWWIEDIHDGDYDQLLQEAEASPAGSNGLYFLPYLSGERTPHNDPFARGTFIGLSPTHTRGDMTRAVLEGVAFALNDSFAISRDLDLTFDEVSIIGGGTKSSLWMQIFADLLQTKVVTSSNSGGPAVGAAILAAVGTGAYHSLEEACTNMNENEQVFEPNVSNGEVYAKMFPVFQKIYSVLKDTFGEIYDVNKSL